LPNDRENLGDIQLFVKPIEPPAEVARFLRAFFLAPLLSPLMLAFPPAAAVLFSDPGLIWYWLIGVLAINWGILAAVHYNDRLTALQNLLKEGFFSGGTSLISLLIIVLAVPHDQQAAHRAGTSCRNTG
jgi:hypothetical protein